MLAPIAAPVALMVSGGLLLRAQLRLYVINAPVINTDVSINKSVLKLTTHKRGLLL